MGELMKTLSEMLKRNRTGRVSKGRGTVSVAGSGGWRCGCVSFQGAGS